MKIVGMKGWGGGGNCLAHKPTSVCALDVINS